MTTGAWRVVVTGAESTGKTTLARALASTFGAAWVPEYARDYLEGKGHALSHEDVEPIARGQMAAEDAARTGSGLLILDTDLVSTAVYARHYFDACPPWIERAARERRADLYLLLHPDVPWVADGSQRARPEARPELHERFRTTLGATGASVVDVRGSWAEREQIARKAIQALASTQTIP
jgi:NadR type nicotinamide-nucleotide adenylyltransferase